MGNAIVIKGVDFSTNNIGKVTIVKTFEESIRFYAESVLQVSPEEIEALWDFANTINTAGFWSKMTGVYPFLGGVDKQAFNMVTQKDDGFRGRGMTYNSAKNCLSNVAQGQQSGIVGGLNIGSFSDLSVIGSFGLNQVSAHMDIMGIGMYQASTRGVTINSAKPIEGGWYAALPVVGNQVFNTQSGLPGNSTSGLNIISSVNINGTMADAIAFNAGSGVIRKVSPKLNISTQISAINPEFSPANAPIVIGGYFGAASTTQPIGGDYYSLVIGKSLTDTEHITLLNAINKLNIDLGRYESTHVVS